ncbi:ankyrin repeat, SAM and basic leucine zipper domain-containing protein 1-like isoform X1 [Microplitis mediator]|uniref:ankyrin repeat, SAM and basic leucine zipper domain-containing protein 1-like isoform X1 n=1 Tax=Microplitis mediator TaxID=375433 RepID=UPI0025534D2D|nr:ankyrin repeat, SAM and basic leucine zipper domain-containing protein 1-like isoform X1 [Microplitis mediator]
MAAYRPAGLSDSSDEELTCVQNNIRTSKFFQKTQDRDLNEWETQTLERNENQDRQFKVINACMTGDIDIIDDYINHGNDVNEFLFSGWTMLLYASSALLPEVIEHLLKSGADPNLHKDGYTPLMAVCDSTKGTTEQTLECIEILLEAKADPDAISKDLQTPLMLACKSKEPEIISELMKNVKNIEACDKDGRTAVFYAVCANKPEVLKVLMKAKASVVTVDRRNLTVKDIAVTKNYEEILQILDFEDDEIENFCPVAKITDWKDAITNITDPDPEYIDCDIANILYSLNLERYRQSFKGMNVKTFLQLTEEDLIRLGMDIQYHRKQFINGLIKFHSSKWKSSNTVKIIKKFSTLSLFDGVISLGNVARQLSIIGSSFCFMKNNFFSGKNNKILTNNESCVKELEAAEEKLIHIKKDFQQILEYAEKIEKNNRSNRPAAYIGSNELKKKTNWTILLTVIVMTGIFLSKTSFIKKILD